jgi:hypothetical protein
MLALVQAFREVFRIAVRTGEEEEEDDG